MSGDSFPALAARLRAGDGDAARAVFERFAGRLLGLARARLGGPLRHKVDPEDIVQSTYKSFFLKHDAGQVEAVGWDSLWGLLALIAVRKCADRANYHAAGRRDASREVGDGWEAIDREPSPDEAAELEEVVKGLFAELDPADRPVLEMSLQGYSTQDISAALGRPERSVRRLRERVRARLEGP
jgi:RNA polymerase sigma-70 factor (ECF subfamily)